MEGPGYIIVSDAAAQSIAVYTGWIPGVELDGDEVDVNEAQRVCRVPKHVLATTARYSCDAAGEESWHIDL